MILSHWQTTMVGPGAESQIVHLFRLARGGVSELNSLSLCIVHLFRFMCGDGEETKQCTLDLVNTHREQLLGMVLYDEVRFV